MKKLIILIGLVLVMCLLVSVSCAPPKPAPAPAPPPTPAPAPPPAPAPKEPIIFADKQFDSIHVNNHMAAFILEHGYGYQSDSVPVDTFASWLGVVRGDIDVNMEAWVENEHKMYDQYVAAGEAVDLGPNYDDNWQGWLVPTFIIKGDPERGIEPMAPDLKSVFDMPKYWELFRDPEDPTKGRFYNGIPGWDCTRQNGLKLGAYGLDKYYNDFVPGSDAALSGSMVAAR